MQNLKTAEEPQEIYSYVQQVNRAYQKEYRERNPEKVQKWRKNAIVNAYKKLIAAEPQYKI